MLKCDVSFECQETTNKIDEDGTDKNLEILYHTRGYYETMTA